MLFRSGDVYPMTTLGKLISASIALFGIAIFAIPTGIISAGFIQEYHDTKYIKNKRSK